MSNHLAKKKQNNNSVSGTELTYQKTEIYSGPLPSPDVLNAYNAVYPGAAELIFDSFRKQTDHRIDIEKKQIEIDKQQLDTYKSIFIRGQYFGLVVALCWGAGAIYVTISGYPWVGTVLGGTAATSIVSIFVVGHIKNSQANKDIEDSTKNKQ